MVNSSERLVAEEQSATNDGAAPSPSAEQDKVKGHTVTSTMRLPEGLSVCNYIKDMEKEQWTAISQGTIGPATRVEVFKVCRSIVQVVSLSALKVVIPAVVRLVIRDPESPPASGAVDEPEKPSSETSVRCASSSSSSIMYIEDEKDVMILKHGVLVDIVPKDDTTRLPSWCVMALKETPELSPKRSCSSVGAASFSGLLKAHYGISVESIRNAVQENLSKLDGVGPAANSNYLNHAIVREVVDTVNFNIAKACKMPHGPKDTSSRELVQIVTSLLDAHAISETGTILAVEENEELDTALASTTGEAMTAVIRAAETCFDGNKKAKSLLASMKRALRILTDKNFSVEDTQLCLMEEKLSVSDKEIASQKANQTHREIVQKLSCEDFHSQATKAISAVLIAEMQPQSSDVPRHNGLFSRTPSVQSILPTASLIVDTFVADIMSEIRSTQSSPMCETLEKEKGPAGVAHGGDLPRLPKSQAVVVTRGLYHKVRSVLWHFFKKLRETSSAHQSEKVMEKNSGVMQDAHCSHDSEKTVPSVVSESKLRALATIPMGSVEAFQKTPVQSDQALAAVRMCHMTQNELDSCTIDVLNSMASSYLPKGSQGQALYTPVQEFVDSILSEIWSSSSSSPTDDTECDEQFSGRPASASLPCLSNLGSENCQTRAVKAVSEVILTAVSGHASLHSCSPDGPVLNKDSSQNLPVGSRCQLEHEQTTPDVSSAAKRIVDQFVSGMKTCLETVQCDSGTPNGGCFTGVSTIFQSVEDTVREFFAHVSCKGKGQVEQLEAQSLTEDLTESRALPVQTNQTYSVCSEVSDRCERQSEDRNGCAKAVTRKMLMLFKAKPVPADSSDFDDQDSTVPSIADSILFDLEICSCSGTRYSGESSLVKSEMAEKLSSDEFHAAVAREVSQVLLKLAQSFTGPVMLDNPHGFSPASDSASVASSVVGTVLDGVRCLMNSTTRDALTQDLKVWSTTRDMYGRLQLNLKNFFTKLSSRQRKAMHSASAKDAISQVLLCIQEELANSSKFQSSDDKVKEIKNVIDSLIEGVGMVDHQADLDQPRSLSSLSGTSEGSWSNWSEESLPEESVVASEVSTVAPVAADTLVAVNIDLSDLPQDEASACVPHETVVRAVNSITSKLGLQNEESSTLRSQGHLTSVWKSLEKALSQGHLKSSHDQIEDVYQILLKGRQTVAAAAKSASDSTLVAMKQVQDIPQEAMVSQIVGMFAQECVRDLFLPCFTLPSSWKSDARAPLRPAAASVSCPGGLSSMAREGEDRAAESPSQILAEVLQVAMDVMVTDVMNILSMATRAPMEMETLLKESCFAGNDVAFNTPDLGLVDNEKCADSQEGFTDYSSLVSVLMIRLLSKLQNEDSLSDDMLDQCRELINKVLSELTAALGVSKTDTCPAGVNIRKVFKVIYNDLLSEYGSKNSVLGALEIEDPSVEKTVVRSLISEITTDVTNDNVAITKKDKRRGCFQFLPNMKKIKSCLKRNKSGSQKNANTDGTTAFSDNIAVFPESSACAVPLDEEPRSASGSPEKRRSLFTRIRTFFKKRSSVVSPL